MQMKYICYNVINTYVTFLKKTIIKYTAIKNNIRYIIKNKYFSFKNSKRIKYSIFRYILYAKFNIFVKNVLFTHKQKRKKYSIMKKMIMRKNAKVMKMYFSVVILIV